MKRFARTVGILVFLSLTSIFSAYSQDFRDAQEALTTLDNLGECKCDTDIKVYKYFIAHKEESIPLLINFATTRRQRLFVAIRALSEIKDDRVLYFLIDLLTQSLQRENNDVESYYLRSSSSELIRALGNYGDNQAVPVIKGASESDQSIAEEALCKLGEISIDRWFELNSRSKDKILNLALSNERANPAFSIRIFDWITKNFPDDEDAIYQSHVGKVTAFLSLEDYESVLKECEFIKISYPDRMKDLWFSIGHLGRRLDELVKFTKEKVGKPKE
jgi:HEAT repeat protein